METDYVANLIPRLLLTLATLGYGAVTLKADLTALTPRTRSGRRTHASTWSGKC
jgi:hypothetical protein